MTVVGIQNQGDDMTQIKASYLDTYRTITLEIKKWYDRVRDKSDKEVIAGYNQLKKDMMSIIERAGWAEDEYNNYPIKSSLALDEDRQQIKKEIFPDDDKDSRSRVMGVIYQHQINKMSSIKE